MVIIAREGYECDCDAWKESSTNPLNWSRRRKWRITLTACYMSSLISIAASAYSLGIDQMVVDLHAPRLLVIAGISFFTLPVALFPLFLAPLGEAIGRRNVYLASYAIFFIFFLPVALARNIQTILISRFVCGAAGSVGSTMGSNIDPFRKFRSYPSISRQVGGTLSDIWKKEERGLPMALFSLSALFGTPIGPIVFSWTGTYASWRWIHWSMLISFVPSAILVLTVFTQETLPTVIRRRKGFERTSTPTLNSRWQRTRQALGMSAIRPLVFLLTEPIAAALCIWISFAWGCLYLFLESVPLVFEPYGFVAASNTKGLAFVGLAMGALIGFAICVVSDRLRPSSATLPEKRLENACAGGVLFTAGFSWYAWSAKPDEIHWIVPQLGTAVLMTGLFLFYVSIFNYLADCYGTYTSSAIAAQSFLRNSLATAFPLFATQMYQALTYPWASSLLGFLAAILALVPFLLLKFGPELRDRSPYARQSLLD